MKQKFTFQIRGNVLADSQEVLEKKMREVLTQFPEFTPTFSSVEVWQDMNGFPMVFNNDGTPFVESVTAEISEPVDNGLEVVKG